MPIQAGARIQNYCVDAVLREVPEKQKRVYLAHLDETPVVLKQQPSPESVEIAVLREVQHPNIVRLEDLIFPRPQKPSDYTFAVMEYAPGNTLHNSLYSERAALHFAAQIASALAHVHEVGYVFNDLSPMNVHVKRRDVKLFDCEGCEPITQRHSTMQLADGSVVRSSCVSTPGYRCEEQMQGENLPSNDVFSLGCLLYAITAGAPPFYDPTLHKTTSLADERLALQEPHIPLRLNDTAASRLVDQMLAPVWQDRPLMRDVLYELHKYA